MICSSECLQKLAWRKGSPEFGSAYAPVRADRRPCDHDRGGAIDRESAIDFGAAAGSFLSRHQARRDRKEEE
jgi:hypothetical protein